MSNTPVLSKKQQKKALSARKGPAKGLRNVLAQPFDTHWPLLKTDENSELENLLKTLMPALKRPSTTIPWVQLRKMTKEERKLARKESEDKVNMMPDPNILGSVVMGVNAVTRSLERNEVCSVLLNANVDPPLIIKHIITMAQMKNVTVLLVPFLGTVMLQAVGFACTAIAFKNIVTESMENYFHRIHKKISDLAANFPSETAPVQLFHTENSLEMSKNDPVDAEIYSNMSNTITEPFKLSTDVYKYRSSRKERVFVPTNAKEKQSIDKRTEDDFIAVDEELDFSIDDVKTRKTEKKERYTDIFCKGMEETSLKADNSAMKLHEYISIGTESNVMVSTDGKIDTEDSCEVKIKKFKSSETKTHELNIDLGRDREKYKKQNIKYISLKVKRLQGNSNRTKATKVSKLKKKL